MICTEISTVSDTTYFAESRLDQEEGGELDSKKLAQKRSRAGRWCWARERELDFFCFSCFPTAELQT